MLGEKHSMDEWISAYKATLFFDTPSQNTLTEFTQTLQRLTAMCGDILHEAPSSVAMTEAARKQECPVCGSHQKVHTCVPHAPKPLQVQQQHKQPAPSKAPAAAQPVVVFVAAAPKASTALLKGMCGEYRRSLVCNRAKCTQKHPEGWIIPPEDCCRDFYINGECKYGADACKYKHLTLEDAQRAKQAAAPSSSAVAAAARVPAATTSRAGVEPKALLNKKGAAAQPQQRQQQGRDSNTFAPLASAAAAAPATPRGKVQTSSLSSLTSPSALLTRSHSTPSVTPSRPAGKKLQFTTAAAAASASASSASAAADEDGGGAFQQQQGRKRRKTVEQEEEKEQASRKQPAAAAQQDQQEQQLQQSEDDEVMVLDH